MDTELENQIKNRTADPNDLLDFLKGYLASEPAVKLQFTGTCSTWANQLDQLPAATHYGQNRELFDK